MDNTEQVGLKTEFYLQWEKESRKATSMNREKTTIVIQCP